MNSNAHSRAERFARKCEVEKDSCIDAADWLDEPDEPTAPLAIAEAGGVGLAAYPYQNGKGFNYYWIEWPRLNTPSKVLAWVHHLSGKTWFSPDMCRDFLDVVYCHFKWERKMP